MAEPHGYFVDGYEPETRVADPNTGSEKGQKLAQIGAMDAKALYTVAEVAGHGADKYSYNNWFDGYLFSLSYDALQRHLMKFWAGEDYDPESGHPHMAHAAWHCLALLSFQLRGTGTDNRP